MRKKTRPGFVFGALAMGWIAGDYLSREWFGFAWWCLFLAMLMCLGVEIRELRKKGKRK